MSKGKLFTAAVATLVTAASFAVAASLAVAAPLVGVPPLREQVSLNGTWDKGGQVPNYIGENIASREYERRVSIPASWGGKRFALEFGAVNHIAQISVNGVQIAEHLGGFIPFSVDLPPTLKAGDSFTLKVVVKGRLHEPIIDPTGSRANKNGVKNPWVLWPVGNAWNKLDNEYTGITDDVWLRAYGPVAIADAFAQTSFRGKTIRVDYTLRNSTMAPQTVRLEADIVSASDGKTEKTLAAPPVTVAPGQTKTVRVEAAWPNPRLWWPDQPHLYHLRSRLVQGGKRLDAETRRFGFREFWAQGTTFRLNGVRFNSTGDYFVWGKDNHWPDSYTPAGWRKTIAALKDLNTQSVRLHKQPAPQFALDIADETGLLLVSESALDGPTGGATPFKLDKYLDNSIKFWVPAWVKANRNHASVWMWSAMNEMGPVNKENAQKVGKVIRDLDPTRMIIYEGHSNPETYEGDPNTDINSRHYPRPFGNTGGVWTGSGEPWGAKPEESPNGIYAWKVFLDPAKPTASGEALFYPGGQANAAQERNAWWQGVWTRGMRYNGWAAIGPASYRWIRRAEDPNDLRIQNRRNAYARVALFDKEYDELGIAPFIGPTGGPGTLPQVAAGANLKRTLVLYNDEFRDTKIDIEVVVKAGDKVFARGAKSFQVALGEHIDIPFSFQVPFGVKEIQVVRKTSKNGVPKFEESRSFTVSGDGTGETSGVVTIG